MNEQIDPLVVRVPELKRPERLDRIAATLYPDFSRSRLQSWIRSGCLLVDGAAARPRDAVAGGETLALRPHVESEVGEPEDLPLEVLFRDEHVAVLNKSAGLVVHPGAGNRDGTLMNALLHHFPEVSGLPRAGIVHRLDRDTTGLMVVALSSLAHRVLVERLQAREVNRQYLALVWGEPTGGGVVDKPVGRHPGQRTKMAVVAGGKPALTRFAVEQRFPGLALMRCRLETGRTHQIRVHMAHIRHPLVGDPVYGGRGGRLSALSEAAQALVTSCSRQMLHAAELGFSHPASRESLLFKAEMPADMAQLVDQLRNDNA